MVVQPNKFIKSHQTVQLQTVNFMASQLYFSEAVKRVQGMKKLFLIEKLAEYFLQMVQFKLDLKGLQYLDQKISSGVFQREKMTCLRPKSS